MAGADGGGGVVLVELYVIGASARPRLVNLSVLAAAGVGDDTLTAGFVVRGGVMPLLVRGVGPTLASLGVADPATDPRLTIFDRAGAGVAINDDWESGGGPILRQTAVETGAFALPGGSKDAATLVALAAGP